MRRGVILAVSTALALSISGCMAAGFGRADPDPARYAAVLASVVRPAADRERDALRRPAETLAFAQVRPGQRIADMIMGGGYFTRLFAGVVGPEGRVLAWQPAEFIAFGANYGEAVAAADAMANVEGARWPIGAPEFPTGLDLVFTAQNYHDLHLAAFPADTAARVNTRVFTALKPGGAYVIVDHHALDGSGLAVAETLHRIDVAALKAEVEAAGFVLEAENTLLANPADPRTASVFDPSIRGRTSQFMLRFRKPD